MFLASRRDPKKIGQSKFVSVEPRTTIGVENRKTFVEVGKTPGNRATALEKVARKVCALFSKLSNFNMYVSIVYIYINIFLFLFFFIVQTGAATETKRKLNDSQFFSMHRSGAWRLGSLRPRSFERKLVFVGEQA